MQFNSLTFMAFFPAVLVVYFLIPRNLRKFWLLIASYCFYMNWNPRYAVLIGASTLITYVSGILLENCQRRRQQGRKKLILILCLVCNLTILAVFKYGNFALETADGILRLMGVRGGGHRLELLLPVGISFYTFQTLGYIIDVYRSDVKAERDLICYALFVSFFPQLVAGPIERSKNLLSQVNQVSRMKLWDAKRVTSGAILMVWGFFLKMVIADRAAILVDTVFDNFQVYGSTELCLAAVGFAIQIYCDFSSYSTIAVGAARIMGFGLMENFNTPYFAVSIRDFWSRWHISLSSWFRDYLYIPLGGNRKGRTRERLNKMVVFLISGLWHGASWNFIVWGGIHGFYQIAADLLRPWKEKLCGKFGIRREVLSWKLLRMAVTFVLVDTAWIFFRADSVMNALRILKRILFRPTPWLWFNGGIYELGLDRVEFGILLASLIILLLAELVRYRRKVTVDVFLMEQNLWFEWLVVILLIVMIFVFGEYGPTFDAQQFIYFQF